jgi:hypothetical protein
MAMTKPTRWLAAAGLGLTLTVTLTPLVAMSRPNPTATDVMTAAMIIGLVSFAVSWLVLVAGPALTRSYAEGNVERTWLERALTAVDVLAGTAAAALTLTTNDIHAPAGPALTIVLAAGLADLGLRYLGLRQS